MDARRRWASRYDVAALDALAGSRGGRQEARGRRPGRRGLGQTRPPHREPEFVTGGEHPRDAWTAFGLGVFGGVIAGLTLLSFAGLQPFGILAIVVAIAIRPRPFGAAGGLIGTAVTWLMLFAGAAARCDPEPCTGLDVQPWILASVAILAIGTVLLGVGIRRARVAR